jgi:type I restriction enzyme S subunit
MLMARDKRPSDRPSDRSRTTQSSEQKVRAAGKDFRNVKVNPAWAKLPIFDRKGWKKLPFGEFAQSVNERVEPADATEEIYVGLEHLDSQNLHIRRWGKGSDVIGTKLRFRKGDLIFGRRRAYQRKLAVAEFDGICSAHAMVVRAKPDMVLPEFLPFLMMSDKFMNRAVEISVGSLSPTINWKTLKLEEFDLPPIEQQRRIAEILWMVDDVVQLWKSVRKDLLELQSSYAVSSYLLGKSHSNDKNLRRSLSELAEINPCFGTKPDDNMEVSFVEMADLSEDGRMVNIQVRKYKDVRKGFTHFRNGDILFAKITPCMENGKGALVEGLLNGLGFGSTEFYVLRPKCQEDAEFIYHLTMTKHFRTIARRFMRGSAGQQRVPSDFLRNFMLAIPEVKRRHEIGVTLTNMSRQIRKMESICLNLAAINIALLNSLFKGSL